MESFASYSSCKGLNGKPSTLKHFSIRNAYLGFFFALVPLFIAKTESLSSLVFGQNIILQFSCI